MSSDPEPRQRPPHDRTPRSISSLVVVERYGEHGGAQEVALDIAEHAQAHGVRAHLILLSPGPMESLAHERGVSTEVIPSRTAGLGPWSTVHLTARLAKRFRTLRPDLVIANGSALRAIVGPAAQATRTPISWHVHDPMRAATLRQRVLGRIQGLCEPVTTVVYSPAAERTVPGLPGPHGRLLRLDPPVDVNRIRAQGGAPPPQGASTQPFLAMFARFTRYKGHVDLIEAVAQAGDDLAGVRVAICGKHDESDPYVDELRRLIFRHGLASRVHLVGFVDRSTKNWLLHHARAVVHPAHHEPFGLTVVEAFAAGTPVVAAAAEGPARTLASGGGLTYPPGDVPALTKALIRIVHDDELHASIAAVAASRADEFGSERHIETLLAVWSEELARRR